MIYCKASELHCELFNILIRGYTFSIVHLVGISFMFLYFGFFVVALGRFYCLVGRQALGIFAQK
jgi:hypothetical protein